MEISFRYFHAGTGRFYHFRTIEEAIKFADEERLLEKFDSAEEGISHTLDVFIVATIVGGINYQRLLEEVRYLRRFKPMK